MGRKRAGGYIFVSYKGDHTPLHVHIETGNGREIGRWDIERQRPLDDFKLTKRLRAALRQLGYLHDDREDEDK